MTFTEDQRVLLAEARRATLATIGDDGRSRLVPICFVVVDDVVWSPLDAKPKAVADVRALARVRDITARPDVTLLVDRWSEDWSGLAWLRIRGAARLAEPHDVPAPIVEDLIAKYPQYRDHDLARRPMIRVAIEEVTSWWASPPVD